MKRTHEDDVIETPPQKSRRTQSGNETSTSQIAQSRAQGAWTCPPSPYSLIQEMLWQDPWQVLVACLLLNRTSGVQVRTVIFDLFAQWPTPSLLSQADDRLEKLIQPLGIYKRRAVTLRQFSRDYLTLPWEDPCELRGVGRYGHDAWLVFCKGEWKEVVQDAALDKELRKYIEYLQETQGEGYGYVRERLPERVQRAFEEAKLRASQMERMNNGEDGLEV